MAIQRVRSKWTKTKILLKASHLRPYIPDTKQLSRESLRAMLEHSDMVYAKPVNGTFGKGVIRIERIREDGEGFRYQEGTKSHTAASLDGLYRGLSDIAGGRGYLVQKGIYLLKHKKRRFDIRVMVQKSPRNEWETTGILGRLAHPAKIVTNYSNGGTIMSIDTLLTGHATSDQLGALKARLRKLGTDAARQLSTRYPNLKELGVDVAIDTKLHPWILEVNSKPHPYIFRQLADKSMFKKIYRYAVAYGGIKAKRSGGKGR